jgi:CheY-like chemotaxis protein
VRMLLVEDDAALNQRLKTALSEAGFAVDVVENGLEAEYMVEVGTYDVVVLDLGLPGRSGLEVLQSWRERGNIMPVLILTARDAWHERVDGLRAGADDYLGKPFYVEELVAWPKGQRLLGLANRFHKQGHAVTIVVAEDLAPLKAELGQFQQQYMLASLGILGLLITVQQLIVRLGFLPLQRVRQDITRLEQGEISQLEEAVPTEVRPLVQEMNRLLVRSAETTRRAWRAH